MALYLGDCKIKISLDNTLCSLYLISKQPSINDTLLVSFDNYILKDSNGLYLIPKSGE